MAIEIFLVWPDTGKLANERRPLNNAARLFIRIANHSGKFSKAKNTWAMPSARKEVGF